MGRRAAGREQPGKGLAERASRVGQVDAILRTLGPRHAGLDRGEIELQRVRIDRFRRFLGVKQPLLAAVGLDERDLVGRSARQAQVANRLHVDGKDAAGRAVLRRHVRDRRAVGDGQVADAVAVELDELPDDALAPQHLRHGEHEVGRRRTFAKLAGELEPHDLRNEHRDRLPEHRGFGLDAAHAPPQHPETVHHRGVRIGADDRIGVGNGVSPAGCRGREDDARQVLEVDLVNDACVGRYDLEVQKRLLAPAQEYVALAVAPKLELRILQEGVGCAELVDLHRVVDDELDGLQRIDARRLAGQLDHRVAHGRKIDHRRHAREVLQEHPARGERDLARGFGLGPSSVRRRFSRRTLSEKGRCVVAIPALSSASRRKMS